MKNIPTIFPTPLIVVAAALLREDGKILLQKRPEGRSMAGLWEFPGGKIEAGETLTDCIAREIREELAIEITVGEHLISIEHTYPTFIVTLIVHNCQYLGGTPQPIECDEICWVKPEDLDKYQFPGANSAIIAAILAMPKLRD